MTNQAAPPIGLDMGRIVQRTAEALGGSLADMAAELGAAREAVAVQAGQIAERDRVIAEKDAELSRVRQVDELLQQRIQQLERDLADAQTQDAVDAEVEQDDSDTAGEQPAPEPSEIPTDR